MITTESLRAAHKIAKWINGMKSRTSRYETKVILVF